MGSSSRCQDLVGYPTSFIRTDLVDLRSRPLDELLRDAKELYGNMREFEKSCVKLTDERVYEYVISMYHLALLKLSTALEDKVKGSQVEDEFVKYIISYYTQDEKNALRELEKFSKLDPNVTPPRVLADIIVAEEGEIYRLVGEAIAKEYVNLGKVLKTWESELKIRGHLTRAFTIVYQARFGNVIDAVRLLLNQQPGWLKRLFKEYESALLGSAEVRRKFEEKFKEAFSKEVSRLENSLRDLEEENGNLRRKLNEVLTRLTLTEDERKKQAEELSRVRTEYESLRSKYSSLLEDLSKRLAEVETLRKELLEKERELERIKASQEATNAEKVAMENEIAQLRKTISDYEAKIRDYRVFESRVRELESILRGEAMGNLIRRDLIYYYYEVVAERARRMLENSEVRIFDPRLSDYRAVKGWDSIEKLSLSVDRAANPISVKSIIFTKLTGLLFKKKNVVIEYSVLSHFTDSDHREFDAQAVDISEFTALWRDRLEKAEREGYHHILVVFSPTGFTDELIRHVTGGGALWTSVASRYTTVYLVDPVKGKIYYNPHDPVAKNNKFLVVLELSEEQVERVVSYVLSDEARLEAVKKNPAVNFLTISDISRATGVTDMLVLRRALSALEEKGVGKVKRVGNELVFEYRD